MPVIHMKDQRAERLGDEITQLYSLITAATHDFLVKIREFDRDGLWEGPGLVSCAHWLNWKCGIGLNAAREKVRVARALGGLPKISEAFRQGRISYSKVRAITRVANAENEACLLDFALSGTAHHVETLVRGYRRSVRLNEPESAEHQHACRAFDYHWDEDGSLVFRGRLPAEVGAMLMQAIKSGTDQCGKEVTTETREPVSQRRADALAEMAETYLATGPASSSSADRYQVMVHVTAETSAPSAHLEDGPGVTAETSKRIGCDSSVSRLVEDENGEPLSIGRKSRVIPPAMRRALKARDQQCRFPGCTHRHFIDGHHIHHWSEGGETSLGNLVLLCRHHHRLVHEGGFVCRKNRDGSIEFHTPAGALVPPTGEPPSRYRGNVYADLRSVLEDRQINATTCLPEWYGERLDQDLAVALLWRADEGAASGDEHA